MINHIGTKEIFTSRLLLRKFKIEDAQQIFDNWAKDPENSKYLTWNVHKTIDDTYYILNQWIEEYKNENSYHWCITFKDTQEVIGSIDVVKLFEDMECCEIGYVLAKKYWNKGIMTEALKAVINYLFKEAKFHRIQAIHHVNNLPSGKVMLKSNMKYEGLLRKSCKSRNGEWVDVNIYSILENEI